MRSRLIVAGAIGLLFVLSTTALFVVNARTGPVDAVAPQPGTYRYRSVGVSTRSSPPTTTERVERDYMLSYERISGSSDETLLRRRSETSGHQDKAWRLDGIYDIAETFVFQSGTQTCEWKPARLAIRLPLRVGSTWKSESTCDRTHDFGVVRQHDTGSGKVTGRRHVRVGGQKVDVFVIETSSTSIERRGAGSAETTIGRKSKGTLLFAPSAGVVVRAQLKLHLLARVPGGEDIERWVETTDDLLSLTPA